MVIFTAESDLWAVVALLPVVLMFFSVLIVRRVKLIPISYITINLTQQQKDKCTFYAVVYDKLFINIISLLGHLQGLK